MKMKKQSFMNCLCDLFYESYCGKLYDFKYQTIFFFGNINSVPNEKIYKKFNHERNLLTHCFTV